MSIYDDLAMESDIPAIENIMQDVSKLDDQMTEVLEYISILHGLVVKGITTEDMVHKLEEISHELTKIKNELF